MMKVGDCQIGFQCEKDKKNLWLGLKIEQTPPSFFGKIAFEFPGGLFYESVSITCQYVDQAVFDRFERASESEPNCSEVVVSQDMKPEEVAGIVLGKVNVN